MKQLVGRETSRSGLGETRTSDSGADCVAGTLSRSGRSSRGKLGGIFGTRHHYRDGFDEGVVMSQQHRLERPGEHDQKHTDRIVPKDRAVSTEQ